MKIREKQEAMTKQDREINEKKEKEETAKKVT